MSGRLPPASVPALALVLDLALSFSLAALGPGEVSAGLEETGMSLGLRLGEGPEELRLSLEAEAEEARLRAGFRSPFLVAGPGSAAGPLRALADPASFGQGLSFGLRAGAGPGFSPPLALDTSLDSATSVLGLSAGLGQLSLAAFALAPGLFGGFLAARPGPCSPPESPAEAARVEAPAAPEAASAGLALSLPLGRGGLCLAAGAVYRRGSEGEGGWSPDPPPEPPTRTAYAALVAEGEGDSGRAAFALAASYGQRRGPGLACRLEAAARAGPLSSRAFAGAAGLAFRNLYGEAPSRRLGAGLDLRLALYRGASLSLLSRLESPARPPAEAVGLPALGRSLSLGLALPLARVSLEPRLELSRAAGESGTEALASLRASGEARGFAPAGGYAWRLELADSFLLQGGGLRSLDLSLGLKSLGGASGPRLFLDLKLTLGPTAEPYAAAAETGSPGAQILQAASPLAAPELLAKIRLGLDLPLRAAARMELEAFLEDIPLALLAPGAKPPGLGLSAAYRAPFGP